MILRDLAEEAAVALLADRGMHLRIGPFVLRLRSDAREVGAHLRHIYPDHAIAGEECAESTVAVRHLRDRRRPWRKLARLSIDEHPFLYPLAAWMTVPMLEWGMNWVVATRAHQYLLLHAAVLEKAGRVVVLPANSGSGKSTLCALLASAGWRLFSDEFAVIDPGTGNFLPMPRALSLKNQSIALVKAAFAGNDFTREFTNTVKGTLCFMRAPADAVARAAESSPAGAIVFPQYSAGISLQVTPVSVARAHAGLVANSMNYTALGARGFACVAALVESAPAWQLTYGDSARALAWFDDAAARFA